MCLFYFSVSYNLHVVIFLLLVYIWNINELRDSRYKNCNCTWTGWQKCVVHKSYKITKNCSYYTSYYYYIARLVEFWHRETSSPLRFWCGWTWSRFQLSIGGCRCRWIGGLRLMSTESLRSGWNRFRESCHLRIWGLSLRIVLICCVWLWRMWVRS